MTRWLLLSLLVFAAACERIPPYAEVCGRGGKNCLTFQTAQELQVWSAEQELRAEEDTKARRKAAAALPIDYREIAFTVFRDYLVPEPGDETLPIRYFASILGDDIDPSLSARLRSVGIVLEPGSAYESAAAQDKAGQLPEVLMLVSLGIDEIEQVESDVYRVGFGYYCGMLCAADIDAFVQCQDNRCRLLKMETLWIS